MSVIDDALRRAEDDGSAADPVCPASPARRDAAASAKGIAHTDAWVASAPRWRPSVATMILAVLIVLTLMTITRPGWGEGFREYVSLSRSVESPVATEVTKGSEYGGRRGLKPAAQPLASLAGPVGAAGALDELPPISAAGGADVEAFPRGVDDAAVVESAAATTPARATPPAKPPQQALVSPQPEALSPDPQVPTLTEPISARFRLEGVVLSGRTKLAVVNGAIIEVGQRIDGATVTAITKGSITIEVDGRTYRIPLRAGAGKRSSP